MANSGEPLHVPEDITVDILRRLPAESLLRFQCVCKSWRELIQSAQFVQSHTNDVNRRRTRTIFFKDRGLPDSSRKKSSGFNVEDEVDKLKKMKLQETIRLKGNYVIHGHCNGIICLSPVHRGVPDILLWNPTLRQCRALPPSRFFSCKHLFQFGFGYDSTNQDYKVVNLHLPIHGISEMYSFKSNSWKPIHFDHLRFLKYELYTNSTCGCLFKGRLHWIVHCDHPGNKMFLVVFDLNEDKFLDFDTPESLYQNFHTEFGHNLGVFRGRLSLLTRNFNEYEIWSLKDDSCTLESWTRAWTRAWKFSPEGTTVYGFPTVPSFSLWFIELTQDGKVVLKVYHRHRDGCHFVYDVEMNRLEVQKEVGLYTPDPIPNYMETLVSVMPETATAPTTSSGRQNCSDLTLTDSRI